MEYRIGSTAVLVLHLCFIMFVVGGAALVLLRRWVAWLHLPAVAWGFLVEAGDFSCPLTGFENGLRVRGGLAGYSDGFVEHYLLGAIYPAHLTRHMQLGLAAFVVLVNVCLYALVWRKYRRHTGRSEVPPADEP